MMHHDKRVGAVGILEPTDAFVGITSVMQTRARIFPGQPFFQHPMEPFVMGPTSERRRQNPGPQALKRLSEDEARGVPAELIFQVRDANGAAVDARLVTVQLYTLPGGFDPPASYAVHGLTSTKRAVWRVAFAVHD
jgi:hypothetical protein